MLDGFKGRLKEVIAVAYNPSTKAMARTPVAAYEYDGQGRLRAEWNPAISPALKATYGYDSEGHVTALTPPGQESWAFTYGGIAGDASTGRLLKVTRAPASSTLWNGEATNNTAVPKLSGTAAVGVRMAVSEGTCVSASYELAGWPLRATVLLSASHPGARPPSLMAMKPLPGHPGVFSVPEVGESVGSETEQYARRVPGAWLVVSRAKPAQRLALLERLRAVVHL